MLIDKKNKIDDSNNLFNVLAAVNFEIEVKSVQARIMQIELFQKNKRHRFLQNF